MLHPRSIRVALVAMLFAIAIPSSSRGYSQDNGAPARPVATVSFAFERPGLTVPKFTLRVAEDGRGSYQGEEAPPPSRYPGVSSKPDPIDRSFTLSAATTHKIFGLARDAHSFNIQCDSKAKNLANTGKKTLSYKGADGEGSCTYNYSDNKSVTQLTEIVEDLAGTMDQGRQLDHLHRYDRLGLDAAINSLAEQVSGGHAPELGVIQPTLQSIATDTNLIQRVRTRANALLAMIPPELREP